MEWSEGRELSKDLKETLEQVISTHGMKEFDCKHCGETFASSEKSFKDGFCGICEIEVSQEMKDAYGLENIIEDKIMEIKLIAENVKLNLGNNYYGYFNIYIDEQNRLDIHPYNNVGDLSDWSYVLATGRDGHDYRLLSKENVTDEE